MAKPQTRFKSCKLELCDWRSSFELRNRKVGNSGERRRGEPSYLGPAGPTSYNHPFLLFSPLLSSPLLSSPLLSSPLRSLPFSSHWPRLESRGGLSRRAGDSTMIIPTACTLNRVGRVTRTDEPLTRQGRVLLGVPSSMAIRIYSLNSSFYLRTPPPEGGLMDDGCMTRLMPVIHSHPPSLPLLDNINPNKPTSTLIPSLLLSLPLLGGSSLLLICNHSRLLVQ